MQAAPETFHDNPGAQFEIPLSQPVPEPQPSPLAPPGSEEALAPLKPLIEALQSGRIRYAGLDVFHAEPLKPDHPLAQMKNVTLSPHAAFRTPEASMNLLRRALDIVRKIEGHPPVPA